MNITQAVTVGPKSLASILAKLMAANKPVLIKGAPGIGKTDIVTQVAADIGYELHIAHPVVDDPIDYKGLPFSTGQGKAEFIPIGMLGLLLRAKKPTALFLDDLGQAPPAVQAAAMQLILGRQINGHKIPDCVTFVAATNRKEDRAGVTGILEPVKSRFVTILELEPKLDDWIDWSIHHNMPETLIAFIRYRPEMLSKFTPTADITNSPCPRTIANAGFLLNLGLGPDELPACLAGAVGSGMAIELHGFLEVYGRLPDPDLALKDPKGIDLSRALDDPAVLYAFTTAIALRTTHKNVDKAVAVIERIPVEFQAMTMRLVLSRDQRIVSTKAYLGWHTKNQHVLNA